MNPDPQQQPPPDPLAQPAYPSPDYQPPTVQQPAVDPTPQYQPGYAQPVYPPPAYPQPEYAQPGYPQPGYPPPGYPQPGYPPPGYGYAPAPPPRKKSYVGLILGIVVGLVVLCCGIGAVLYMIGRNMADSVAPAPTLSLPSVPTFPGEPSRTPDGEPSGTGETFKLAPGTKVIVTDSGDEVELTVSDPSWRATKCSGGLTDPRGEYLTVEVTFTVTKGTGSINPLYFTYIDPAGSRSSGFSGLFSGCDEPGIDAANNVPEGETRVGKLTFDVEGDRGGVVQFVLGFGDPTASWQMP